MGRVGALRIAGGLGYAVSAPPDPEPPPPTAIVGYADLAGVTGGGTSVTHDIDSGAGGAWAALKAALTGSGTRYIRITGSSVIDGGGETVNINNGNLTVDGEEWTKSLKSYHFVLKGSNVIFRYMRLRPGDAVDNLESGSALTMNPGASGSMDRIVLDHCDLMWAVDVNLNTWHDIQDMTVQYCTIGAALLKSANFTSGNPGLHGYGFNTHAETNYGQRITMYRNFFPLNRRRHIRGYATDEIEWVNNAWYDYGDASAGANPQAANIVGNMFKKGPETTTSEVYSTEPKAPYATAFANSVYVNGNIGITAAGGSFTPTFTLSAGVARGTPYGGGLHNVTAASADATLFAAVVAAAGCDDDAVATTIKNHALAGTSDGYYNGPAWATPHPSW